MRVCLALVFSKIYYIYIKSIKFRNSRSRIGEGSLMYNAYGKVI